MYRQSYLSLFKADVCQLNDIPENCQVMYEMGLRQTCLRYVGERDVNKEDMNGRR